MLILFCRPRPATRPKSSHRRRSPPCTMRASTCAATTQSNWSMGFIEKNEPVARKTGAASTAKAASVCPGSPAPMRPASRPVRNTVAAKHSTDGSRMAHNDSPSNCRVSQSTNMESGG